MNRNLKGLLIAFAVYGAAFASTSDNKTHLNVRIDRDTVPAYTTFHEMIKDKNEDRLGGNVELTGHYGHSVNDSHLAKSFGTDGTGFNTVVAADTIAAPTQRTVAAALILHDQNGTNALAGQVNYAPKQTVYGLRLDYVQSFDKWVNGLYAHVILPFAHMTNDINMTTANTINQDNVKLADLLTGAALPTRTTATDAHTLLKYGKMVGNSESGLGDIEARIGWNFLDGKKYHAGIHGAVVFPTSDKPNEEFLWAARTGDSKWGLGAGADASAILWEKDEQNLKLSACAQYKYLFEGDEHRTLGLKELRYSGNTWVNPILSQYFLVGKTGVTGLQPLANVSTLEVDVKPGSQIDATVSFAYNNGGFTLDLGYNIFWKEAEEVTLSSTWDENTYGVASYTWNQAAAFAANGSNTAAGNTDGWIKKSDLALENAAQPATLKHKVFTGIGYNAKSWEYPVLAGVGVAYEIPSSNKNAAEGYSLWAKLGVAF